jgi:hypothetical protein
VFEVSAEQQRRNFSNCDSGWGDCDRSKLSPLQVSKVAVAEQQRNFSDCTNALEACDYSKLTP